MIQISQEICDFFDFKDFFTADEEDRSHYLEFLKVDFCEHFKVSREIFTDEYYEFLLIELQIYGSTIYIQHLQNLIRKEITDMQNITRVKCQAEFFTG